nr:hypothetical protein [Rhodococcus sp. RDE2]
MSQVDRFPVQTQGLAEAKTCSGQQLDDEPVPSIEYLEQVLHLVTSQIPLDHDSAPWSGGLRIGSRYAR